MKMAVKVFVGVISAAVCVSAVALSACGDDGEDGNIIVFGSEIRQIRDGWGDVTDFTERESFTYSLMRDSESYDYAMAEIAVGEESAAFNWTFEEEREPLTEKYSSVKDSFTARSGEEASDYWLFLKVKTDDVYDLDIWHKVQEVWGSDLEKKHELFAAVNKTGSVCEIYEYNEGSWIGEWSVYIKDDFLYILECVDHQISSSEETKKPLRYFYWDGILDVVSDYCTWGMDDELFYWRDHDERIITLENPTRVYTQVPGKDGRWSHFPGKQPCGIMQAAEYTVSLSEGGPGLKICFTLEGDAMELRLPDIGSADYDYTMEVLDAASGELLQTAEARLCVDAIDTLRFEDMDGDGYLDMHIVYPEHWIVAESDAEDQFSYQYYHYRTIPRYWIWDNEERIFACMTEWELSDYVRERREKQREEERAEKERVIIVQEGDSLWRIAQKYLGDGAKYKDLYDRNKAVIGADPDRIMPGMQLDTADIGEN